MRTFAAAAALAASLAVAGPAAAVAPRLAGTDGPGFTITLKIAGKPVTQLRAGAYTIVVTDRSAIHNFHLTGPGVNEKTSVVETGRTIWTLKLRRGTYRYVCDPHRTIMKGSFRVT